MPAKLDRSRLVSFLEDIMLRNPPSDRVIPIALDGVRGRRTPISSPFSNVVGVTGPGVTVPDESIDGVIEEFRTHGLAFGWLIGPNSPKDLSKRLEARGVSRAEEIAGLVLTDSNREIPVPGDVCVREVESHEQELFATLLSRAFGLPLELVSFLCEILYFAASGDRCRNYFAFVAGESEPVATASTVYHESDPAIVLGGSAVVEEFRGRGIYRSLVHRRLADARADGIEAAVIQAMRATSGPICSKLGFEEVCAQEFWAWSPELKG